MPSLSVPYAEKAIGITSSLNLGNLKRWITAFAAFIVIFTSLLVIRSRLNHWAWTPRTADGIFHDNLRVGFDAQNYSMTSAQCDYHFQGYFQDIYDSVAEREGDPITEQELDDQGPGSRGSNIRAMINGPNLYIISDSDNPAHERSLGLLSAIHRAIITDPEPHSIPSIEFIISVEDWPETGDTAQWGLTRKRRDKRNWLVPDFGMWTWPLPTLGSYASIRDRIADVERDYDRWIDKVPKLIWRGATNVGTEVREALIKEAKDQPWADVEAIDWSKGGYPPNMVPIEDHCRYQFIAQTEGVTYSGRQKYIQNCESVIMSHDLTWIQPWTRMMVPEGPNQNYVQLRHDFSDLKDKMEYYLSHPEEAARIARNSAHDIRDRYLTPAAQACYWRKLIKGYGSVSFEPRIYEERAEKEDGKEEKKEAKNKADPSKDVAPKRRGMSYETYIIHRKTHY